LIRSLLAFAVTSCLLAQAPAQPQQGQAQQGQLDASQTLFAVLAAINAVGYDVGIESNANSPVRKQIREIIAAKKLDSIERLKRFFDAHRQKNPDLDLNQYISFAMSVDGPPDFQLRMPPAEVPLDVRPLDGLDQILAAFYAEAGIEDLWRRAQPAYEQVIAGYHGGVTKALLEANAYLRNATSGYRGRRFQIYVDLLGAPNQIQSRSFKDDYYVVVTPSPEPQIDEIRHAYLHYLLDPLALRYFEQLNRLKGVADFAMPAPSLSEAYKEDFLLLSTECLIKAVESRMTRGPNRQAMVDQALREGFVLTPALAEGLAVYEKQEQSLRLYLPDLLRQVDLAREDRRLEKVQFAKEASVKMAKTAPPLPEPVLTGPAKTLADAEAWYEKRNLDRSRQDYLKVLQETGENTFHAKAYYGLARIAALQKDPELAEKLFQKTLELAPDAETKAWSYLYLGRLADASGDREQAAKQYKAALAIDGVPASVKAAAEKGLAAPFRKDK
jgi:tetratricopeptide (TPR) repeat protein